MTIIPLPTPEIDIKELRGLVATVNLTGTIEAQTSECLLHLALWNASRGFTNVEYQTFPAQLVEDGRDAVCQHALKEDYDWLLMFDGDATFPPDSLALMLQTAFKTHPDADAVGAYAQLKGSHHPTIDTGTGSWEPLFPGNGVLPAIRTGGHFLFIKTPVLKRFGPPWFRTRHAISPSRALADLDNFARMNFNGRNPLQQTEEWEELVSLAKKAGGASPGSVGEDSGFCDALTAAGGRLYVNTDLVTGHIERRVITPQDLRDKLRNKDEQLAAAVGVKT